MTKYAGKLAAVALCTAIVGGEVQARELTFGSWTPPRDPYNTKTLAAVFEQIKQDTKGSITWKLVAGGALLDARGTVPGVKDGLADAGLGIAPYVPNLQPATNMIFSTHVWGNDVVAATAAAVETVILNCPECLDEHKAQNALAARRVHRVGLHADVPGQREDRLPTSRARKSAPRQAAYSSWKPSALCQSRWIQVRPRRRFSAARSTACMATRQWLEGFGYWDVAKSVFLHPMGIGGPAMALYLNRNTWLSLSPDEKKAIIRGAALASAMQAIDTFILEGERVLEEAKKKGIALNPGDKEVDVVIAAFAPKQRAANIEAAKKFGVKEAESIMAAYLKNVEKWRALVERDRARREQDA